MSRPDDAHSQADNQADRRADHETPAPMVAPDPGSPLDAAPPAGPSHVLGTLDPLDPLGHPEPSESGEPEPSRRSRGDRLLRYGGGAIALLLIVVVVSSAFIRVPLYRFSPGSLYSTESLISVDGSPSYKADGGRIDFTTVSSKKASVLDWALARFDSSVDLIDAELIEGGRTTEETRQANLEMMTSAKQVAEVVALRKLGYPIVVKGTGALVRAVTEGSPAATALQPNDTIVQIDGQPVSLGDDAVAILGTHKPGDTVTLKVESEPGDPGEDVPITLASRCVAAPAEPCSAEDAQKPLLGITLATRDTQFQLPVTLTIDTKDVGGPSAGLALTLGVIDVLTPGSLTGGAHVATTGTIDLRGNVGPIGGIKQKTHLAMRNGISLFLVPMDELDEATRYAEGSTTKVVGVATLDDALAALQRNGGSTEVVDQVAAANAPTTTLPAN